MLRRFTLALVLLLTSVSVFALASNFADRKAIIVNICPHIELSEFSFANADAKGRTRFEQYLSWKNIGTQAAVAIDLVILKYDAFDQRVIGTRWTVTGHDSVNWTPLAPGQSAKDGTLGYSAEEVFTAIAYVRSVRLADGTVWRVNENELAQNLKKVSPSIKEFGSFKPDAKPKAE